MMEDTYKDVLFSYLYLLLLLSDIDCRWQVISGSADDRTEEERGLKVS